MTAIADPSVKDRDLRSIGFVEQTNINSIKNLTQSKLIGSTSSEEKDFVNTFICLLIFYVIFCVSLYLHILFDLGLASFIKKKFIIMIEVMKKTKNVTNQTHAFA